MQAALELREDEMELKPNFRVNSILAASATHIEVQETLWEPFGWNNALNSYLSAPLKRTARKVPGTPG